MSSQPYVPSPEPLPVARELIERVYLRHGSPRLLFSDQGLEFLNKIVAHVSALFQIKHVPTTAGNPQANGLVEAHNKESKRQLTAFTNARQNDWDTFLAVIQFAYMTTVSTRTGYTPFSYYTGVKLVNLMRHGLEHLLRCPLSLSMSRS